MKQKSLVKNSIFNIIYMLINLLFPFITSIYVARILTTESIGQVAYAQNIVSYFVVVAALGLPTYGIREYAKVRDDYKKKCKLFSELMIINFISSLICTIAYFVLILSNINFRNNVVLFLICGLSILFNFINIDWLYQGEEEYGYITKRSILIKVISFIMMISLVRTKKDYIYYALITVIATGGNYICNVYNAHNYVKFTFKNLQIIKHLRSVFILAIIIFLSQIYSKIDTTMIGIFCEESNVAYYTYAQKIIIMVLTLCTSITGALLPRMSYYFENDREHFFELLNKAYRIICILSFPIAIGLFVTADKFVLFLYGSNYSASVVAIRIFCMMIIIRPFSDLFCYQCVYAIGKEKIVIPASFIASIINIILNIILIPKFQQNGAAVASIISELITQIIQFIYVKRIIGYKLSLRPLYIGVLSALIMGGIAIIPIILVNNLFISLFLSVLLGAISYFILNVIFKNETIYDLLNFVLSKVKRKLTKS